MFLRYWIIIAIIFIIANNCFAVTPEGMVFIPGGSFDMGIDKEDIGFLEELGSKVPHMNETNAYWWFAGETPRHTVEVDPFYMDIHEVTNRQFEEFVKETGYKAEGKWERWIKKDRIDRPVVNVTWNDARAYSKWAGKRLPTETEWEYAARGGRDVKWFPWGDLPDRTKGNFGNVENFFTGLLRLLRIRNPETKAVGSYPPNGYGLYDMCGNVSEWCDSVFGPYPGGPQEHWIYSRYGPYDEDRPTVERKIVRGGSWMDNPVFVRINYRGALEPDVYDIRCGFRCVKSVK